MMMKLNIHISFSLFLAIQSRYIGIATCSKFQVHIPKSLYKSAGYDHRDALFGTPPFGGSIQQQVYYTNASLCDSDVDRRIGYPERPIDETGRMQPWQSPFILLVDRGGCTFVQKVRNAQLAGAAAVLIADDVCMCAHPECITSADATIPANCETTEPIMADDGTGMDISIPSFLIFKQDGDPIKDTLRKNSPVQVEMSFTLPTPDARVEYELWTTPIDAIAQPIEKTFQVAAVALTDKAFFTPHMYIYDGIRAGCDDEGVDRCYNLCTNAGRYCAVDPDNDPDHGISGADVIEESLRRLCIWSLYGSDGIGKAYWSYVKEFSDNCAISPINDPEKFKDPTCIQKAMDISTVKKSKVDQCMSDSGGLEGSNVNTLLDKEVEAKNAAGVVLIPTLYVNQVPVRGALTFSTTLNAICAGYMAGSEPVVCQKCSECHDALACVQAGKCAAALSDNASNAVSVSTFTATILAMLTILMIMGLIVYKRQQRQMKDQVRGIVAQYMPLQQSNGTVNTSLAIPDDDHEFS